MERVFRLFIVFILISLAGLIYFCLTDPDLIIRVGLKKLKSPTGIFIVFVLVACCLKAIWDVCKYIKNRPIKTKNLTSKTQHDYVWLSQAFRIGETATGLLPFSRAEGSQGTEIDMDIYTRIENAKKVDPDEFPSKLYASKEFNDHLTPRKHLMRCGFYLISDPMRQVLGRFDLGESGVHPVEIYNPDKKTKWTETYWHLNVVGHKDALLEEKSNLKKIYSKCRDIWRPSTNLKDDEICFSAVALEGIDLWMDERLLRGFLLSDRLVSALKAANLDKPWNLVRCKISEI